MDKAQAKHFKQYVASLRDRYKTKTRAVKKKASLPTPQTKPPDQDLTKNEIVGILWEKGIEHNKRQTKAELIELLENN